MNTVMVDVTDLKYVSPGDEVVFFWQTRSC